MTFAEYQKQARTTAQYPVIGQKFIYPALGLAGETGEVLEKIKKICRDDNGVISTAKKDDLTKELGDILWYVANLGIELDLELEDIAQINLAKLASRQDRNVIHGQGDNR